MMNRKLFWAFMLLGGVFLPIGCRGASELIDPPLFESCVTNRQDNARAALMYINHLNFVIAKLGNMDDLVALQQEYENLTDDNLNLQTIRDETTLQLILQLMDQMKNLQCANIRSVQAQVLLEQEKRDAIWKALPQPAFLIIPKGPFTLALAVGGAVVTSVQNYYNAQAMAERKCEKTEFKIGYEKLAYINEINKELFSAQWRLMRDYGLSDHARVTREEARLFLGFSELLRNKAEDSSRNGIVFDVFRNHEREMENLPFYWITRAASAQIIKDEDDLVRSCQRYFMLYRNAPIVRKDMDACAMALLYVSAVMKKMHTFNDTDKNQIRKWLEFVLNTVRIPQWETKFAVAMLYREIGDDDQAKKVLRMTLSEVYACVKVWEESGKRTNIFRKTPALEKAFGGVVKTHEKFTKKWPEWRKESECLVPYEGFVWVAGVLYEMGDTDVFTTMKCDRTQYGIAYDYITGKNQGRSPNIRVSGSTMIVESNGLWEDSEVTVMASVDGMRCTQISDATNSSRVEFQMPRPGEELKIVVRTRMGILVQYIYNDGNTSKPSETKIFYPWSREAKTLSRRRLD